MQKVLRESVTKQVINSIIGYITDNSLSSGDKLPTEREFAQMYDVGIPAVREAVSALSLMGIVKIIHGKGIFFANLNGAYMAPIFDVYYRLGLVSDTDGFTFWRILESAAAREAAKHITDEELEELRITLEEAAEADRKNDRKMFTQLDTRFHNIVCNASHNILLSGAASSIDVIQEHLRSISAPIDFLRSKVHSRHVGIYEALKAHNPDEAERKMKQHITEIERTVDAINNHYDKLYEGIYGIYTDDRLKESGEPS